MREAMAPFGWLAALIMVVGIGIGLITWSEKAPGPEPITAQYNILIEGSGWGARHLSIWTDEYQWNEDSGTLTVERYYKGCYYVSGPHQRATLTLSKTESLTILVGPFTVEEAIW